MRKLLKQIFNAVITFIPPDGDKTLLQKALLFSG